MSDDTDPQPFEIIDGNYRDGLVLIADHARNVIPAAYGTLGLPASDFRRHIAYDIGVEAVTRRLAEWLAAPAVLCGFSRLLVDPNRGEDDPTLIRQLYDHTIIPGNYPLEDQERKERLDRWYRPYHRAVAETIGKVEKESGSAPLLVAIHSFTPLFQGVERPWHISLLWDMDDRAVKPLFELLSHDQGLCVGDNEPYDGALAGDTMSMHGTANGYAHVLIEIRQDLIADEKGQAEWAGRLGPALDEINRLPDIHKRQHYGSRAVPPGART